MVKLQLEVYLTCNGLLCSAAMVVIEMSGVLCCTNRKQAGGSMIRIHCNVNKLHYLSPGECSPVTAEKCIHHVIFSFNHDLNKNIKTVIF